MKLEDIKLGMKTMVI